MSNKIKLDADEKSLLNSYERDEWRSISALQETLAQYQSVAAGTLEAKGLVSVILPTEDLSAIQEQATKVGVSYQTLIVSILHRFVTGTLVEKPRG